MASSIVHFPRGCILYGDIDQPGNTVWLSVNHCGIGPVDRMILQDSVVSYSGFVYLCQAGSVLTFVNACFVSDSYSTLCSCSLTPRFLPGFHI